MWYNIDAGQAFTALPPNAIALGCLIDGYIKIPLQTSTFTYGIIRQLIF